MPEKLFQIIIWIIILIVITLLFLFIGFIEVWLTDLFNVSEGQEGNFIFIVFLIIGIIIYLINKTIKAKQLEGLVEQIKDYNLKRTWFYENNTDHSTKTMIVSMLKREKDAISTRKKSKNTDIIELNIIDNYLSEMEKELSKLKII